MGQRCWKSLSLIPLAPPHPLPHLEVPSLNYGLPKVEGLKRSPGPTPAMELGTLKGKAWPKAAERDREKMAAGKGDVE